MRVNLEILSPRGVGETSIQWADFSANIIRYVTKTDLWIKSGKVVDKSTPGAKLIPAGEVGWFCKKVSPGCTYCYAEAINKIYGNHLNYAAQNLQHVTPVFDEGTLLSLRKLNERMEFPRPGKKFVGKAADGRPKIFHGDMTDLWGDWVPVYMINRILAAVVQTPMLDHLFLTKRPDLLAEHMRTLGEAQKRSGETLVICPKCGAYEGYDGQGEPPCVDQCEAGAKMVRVPWPIPNAWFGTSIENQDQLERRMDSLLACDVAVRFLSLEPLLGDLDFEGWGAATLTSGEMAFPLKWSEFQWPEWVPTEQREQIQGFWSETCHRNPRQWWASGAQERVPEMGSRVGVAFDPSSSIGTVVHASSPRAKFTGRYLHSWNNMGRVVRDDGETFSVSTSRGPGFFSPRLHADGKCRQRIHMVIIGGESGPSARFCHPQWRRNIIAQCDRAGIPVFHKQQGRFGYRSVPDGHVPHACCIDRNGDDWAISRSEDGRLAAMAPDHHGGSWKEIKQIPVGVVEWFRGKDPHGGDPSEWPAEFQRREWPKRV